VLGSTLGAETLRAAPGACATPVRSVLPANAGGNTATSVDVDGITRGPPPHGE
jgi:hypothetical protein